MFCVRPGQVGQKPGHPGEERKRQWMQRWGPSFSLP
jgi:hypothetical protein